MSNPVRFWPPLLFYDWQIWMPHSSIPEYIWRCAPSYGDYVAVNGKLCDAAFHCAPSLLLYTQQEVLAQESLEDNLWEGIGYWMLCIFWWPLKPGISALSELSNFAPKIISPVTKNESQILGFQLQFLLKYSVREDQKPPLGTLIKKNKR